MFHFSRLGRADGGFSMMLGYMELRCLFEGSVLVFVFSAANVASKDLGRAAATGAVAPPKREKVSWILELSLRVIFLVAFFLGNWQCLSNQAARLMSFGRFILQPHSGHATH